MIEDTYNVWSEDKFADGSVELVRYEVYKGLVLSVLRYHNPILSSEPR